MSKELADQSTLNKLTSKFDGKSPIRVHFLDNSSKVFLAGADDYIKDLLLMCLEKLQIEEAEANLPYYGIYESKTGGSIDGCLDMEATIEEILTGWTDGGVEKTAKFLFCIRLFIPAISGLQYKDVVAHQLSKPKRGVTQQAYLEAARVIDANALHIQHIQAVYNVITGRYVTTPEQAIDLGAIHFLIKFGFFNDASHVPGFLSSRIVEFIPVKHLKSSTGGSIEEWENKLLKKAQEFSVQCDKNNEGILVFKRNKKTVTPQRQYMDIIYQMPLYGCTFFKVAQSGVRVLPDTLVIAVHYLGMFLYDKTKKNILCSFHIEDLFRWGFKPNVMFYFEIDSDGVLGTQLETGTLEFETSDGKVISDLLTDYAVSFLKEREAEDLRHAQMKAGTFGQKDVPNGAETKKGKNVAPAAAAEASSRNSLPPAPPSKPAPTQRPQSMAAGSKGQGSIAREHKAATKIQALVRGALLRGEWAKEDAAILIQAIFRGYQGRVKLSVMIEDMIAAGDL